MTEDPPGRLRARRRRRISRDKNDVRLRSAIGYVPPIEWPLRTSAFEGPELVVDRSTTGLNSGEADELSVDGEQLRGQAWMPWTNSNTFCQGEGRGFESRLPLPKSHFLAGLMRGRLLVQFTVSAHHLPITGQGWSDGWGQGFIRQGGVVHSNCGSTEGLIQARGDVAG